MAQRGMAPILVVILITVAALAGGFWVYQSNPSIPPNPSPTPKVACTQEAKLCPDGTAVGRVGPNCDFAPCPTPESTTSADISDWNTFTDTGIGIQFKHPSYWLMNVNLEKIQPNGQLETGLKSEGGGKKVLKLEGRDIIIRLDTIAYVQKDDANFIVISGRPKSLEKSWTQLESDEFEEIISTLKFLTNDQSSNSKLWKVFEGELYNFKYPSGWTVKEFYNKVYIVNQNKTVAINIFQEQPPYGFEGPNVMDKNNLNVTVEGRNYTALETIVNNKTAFVDLKIMHNQDDYYIIFGTGYPLYSLISSPLQDYFDNRETILEIISTLRITDS